MRVPPRERQFGDAGFVEIAEALGDHLFVLGGGADMERWLQTAVPNDTRDFAVAAFAGGMAEKNSDAALEWGARITNAEIRNRTLDAIMAAQAAAAAAAK